jgi:putative transposase
LIDKGNLGLQGPQIAFVLKQAEDGAAIAEVCRKAGISDATFYIYGRLSHCKSLLN